MVFSTTTCFYRMPILPCVIAFLWLGVFGIPAPVEAQWQKVTSLNVGVTGRIAVHGSTLFLYGSQAGFKLYRSTDQGNTWSDFSTGAPGSFSHIHSHGGSVYAVGVSTVYTTANNGETWTPKATVNVTGNGALMGLTSDGTSLYAWSNRKSIFRSTDNGSTWTEIIVNDPANLSMAQVMARGNRLVAIFLNVGAYISEDGGATWVLKNPTGAALSGLEVHQNTIFGFGFATGLFRLDQGSPAWVASNTGLPPTATLPIPKTLHATGSSLVIAVTNLLSTETLYYTSSDNGATWGALSMEGMPKQNGAGGSYFIAATPSYIHTFYYGNGIDIGVYRTSTGMVSSAEKLEGDIPKGFVLHQNYPNPFNPSTTIRFSLPVSGAATMKIFDFRGREVTTLVHGIMPSGVYTVRWEAVGLPSGIYLYQLRSNGFIENRRMLLIK